MWCSLCSGKRLHFPFGELWTGVGTGMSFPCCHPLLLLFDFYGRLLYSYIVCYMPILITWLLATFCTNSTKEAIILKTLFICPSVAFSVCGITQKSQVIFYERLTASGNSRMFTRNKQLGFGNAKNVLLTIARCPACMLLCYTIMGNLAITKLTLQRES